MILLIIHKLFLIAPTWIGPMIMALSGDAAAGEHGEGHGDDHGGTPHLPSAIGMIFGMEGWAHHWINVIYAFGIALFFVTVSVRVYAKRQMIPGGQKPHWLPPAAANASAHRARVSSGRPSSVVTDRPATRRTGVTHDTRG